MDDSGPPSTSHEAEVFQDDPRLPRCAFAKLVGEGIEYYVRKYEIVLGRTSKTPQLDVALGENMNISRQHAKIVYNFERGAFELIVLGKNGVTVDNERGPALYTPDSPALALRSQDLLIIGDKRFHFLLPALPEHLLKRRRAPAPAAAVAPTPPVDEQPSPAPHQPQPQLAPTDAPEAANVPSRPAFAPPSMALQEQAPPQLALQQPRPMAAPVQQVLLSQQQFAIGGQQPMAHAQMHHPAAVASLLHGASPGGAAGLRLQLAGGAPGGMAAAPGGGLNLMQGGMMNLGMHHHMPHGGSGVGGS